MLQKKGGSGSGPLQRGGIFYQLHHLELMVHGDNNKQLTLRQFHCCAKVSPVNEFLVPCTRNRLTTLPSPWLADQKKYLIGSLFFDMYKDANLFLGNYSRYKNTRNYAKQKGSLYRSTRIVYFFCLKYILFAQ